MNQKLDQVKNSWDYVTLRKVGKGALISGGAAFAIYFAQWIMTADSGVYTPLAVAFAGFVINSVREYLKGEKITIVE